MDNSNKLITIIILALLSINIVVALGVNAPYWNENPLKMYAGETKEVVFPLANSVNEPTTEATVSLTKGSEITEIISGEKYTVSPGENNENIILRITIPENAKIGDNYASGFKVLYIPAGEEGNVKLNVEYNVDFPIEVVNKADATSTTNPDISNTNIGSPKTVNSYKIIVISIIVIIIIILIIMFILFKRKKDNEKIGNKFK